MSKKCADCGCAVNPNVIQGMYYCPRCDDDKSERDVLPLTVFDYITQSVEKLAEKLVYRRNCKMIHNNDKASVEYWTYSWKSTIVEGSFETYEEAYEATLEELKNEVEDEC